MIYTKNIKTNSYLNHNSKSKSNNNDLLKKKKKKAIIMKEIKLKRKFGNKVKTNDKHLQWKGIQTCKKPLEEIVTTTYL